MKKPMRHIHIHIIREGGGGALAERVQRRVGLGLGEGVCARFLALACTTII